MRQMQMESDTILLRAWRHGDDVVARITPATGETIALAGRDHILRWVSDWLEFGHSDGTVTQLQRSADD